MRLKKKLLRTQLKDFLLRPFVEFLIIEVRLRFCFFLKTKPHGLSAPLIVSLTSYPGRFQSLHLTLMCLLGQSVKPDKVILWIAKDDAPKLPASVLKLKERGLEIGYCEDLKSYKKLLPALARFPDSYIVTADDDLYYRTTWLEELVKEVPTNPGVVLCHRAHRITLGADGLPLPYLNWDLETRFLEASSLIFPTTGSGALYPPASFGADVLNIEEMRKLAPSGDDIWFYWMLRKNGGVAKKVGRKRRLWTWPGTEADALWHQNVIGGKNDLQIANMIAAYGFPNDTGG